MKWLVGVLALAACHGGISAQTDAPIGATSDSALPAPDGSPDAPPDAATSNVSVTVHTSTGDGAIDATAVAIFYDGAGTVLQFGTVNANGVAYGNVPDGGMVTVLQAHSDPNNLAQRYERFTTIRGLKSGDHLIVGVLQGVNYKAGATDVMTANYTALDPQSSPSWLLACGDPDQTNTGAPFTLTFHASCETSTFDLLALDHGNGMVEYDWHPAVTRSPGGTITVGTTWTPLSHTATAVTNTAGNYALGVSLSQVVGGVPFVLDQAYLPAPSLGTNDVSLAYAPVATPIRFTALLNEGLTLSETHVVITTGSPATTEVDLSALPLPIPSFVTQTATGVTWTEVARGTPDERIVAWFAMWTDGNLISHDASWEVFEPAGGTTSLLTTVPSAYAADDPSGAQLQGASVTYVDYDNLAGYDAARPLGASLVDIESNQLGVDHVAHSISGGTYP